MNQRPTLREQIDACRPDSDDLHLPEHAADLAELKAGVQQSAEIRGLWERSQRDDRAIRGAMLDVALPIGLEQRLLAAVQAAHEQPLACVEKVVDEEVTVQEAVSSVRYVSTTIRRRWVVSTIALTAAASILAAYLGSQFLSSPQEPISKDLLAAQVQDWLQAADPLNMNWDAKATNNRFPGRSLYGKVEQAGSVVTRQGTITVYDVRLSNGSSQAVLLVLPTTAVYRVDSMPASKVEVSGHWNVGSWQTDGVLYVLAVRRGGDTNLQHFIRPQRVG